MSDTEDNPLKRVVVDKDAVDRERLADAIEGVLGVNGDTGAVVTQLGYHDLDNKPKFVAKATGSPDSYRAGHYRGK